VNGQRLTALAVWLHRPSLEVLMLFATFSRLFFVLLAGIALAGCELVGDIFQAGMAVGIFLVIAAVALIIFLVNKVRRRV
jgi:hypothetical protein